MRDICVFYSLQNRRAFCPFFYFVIWPHSFLPASLSGPGGFSQLLSGCKSQVLAERRKGRTIQEFAFFSNLILSYQRACPRQRRGSTSRCSEITTGFILPSSPPSIDWWRSADFTRTLNASPTVLHIWAFCDCLTLITPALPVQGHPREVHHTGGVHPNDQGHHHGNSQGGGRRELGSAGGCDRHGQPEPQSHLWYVGYLQGVNPRRPARTVMQTSPGCQRVWPAESR